MSTALKVHDGEPGTAVAQRDASRGLEILRPIAHLAAVIEAQNATRALVHEALKEGRDFGVIPGTDKPTLLKPGAERVALAFGCYYGEPEIIEKEVDHDREVRYTKTKWIKADKPENWRELKAKGLGRNRQFDGEWVWQEKQEEPGISYGLYRYVVRVPVINRATGEVIGYGIGSCSTMESKYIDRPRDCENTVIKMSHKRGIVSAALVTYGLSDEFTQDVEDLPMSNAGGASDDQSDAPASRRAAAINEPEAKCPKCNGRMWDNRARKTNPKAPDFKCRNGECDGVYWPGQWPPPPVATEEQKARIMTLLETADLNDEAKAKARAAMADTEHPLSIERAERMIAKLEKLSQPADPNQATMDLATDGASGSGGRVPADTRLAPGAVQDALDLPAEGEQRDYPTTATAKAASTSSTRTPRATAPAATTRTEARAPGNERAGVAELTKRLGKILENETFSDAERAHFRDRMAKAPTLEALAEIVADAEEIVRVGV